MKQSIPLVDIAPWFAGDDAARDAVAGAFDRACREWGFVVIAGHGIAPELMTDIDRVTKAFFDLPVAEKATVGAAGRPGGRGYYGMKAKSLARTLGDAAAPGDLRESFRAGVERFTGSAAPAQLAHVAPNVWPANPAEMQSIWTAYFDALTALGAELMRVAARALGLADDWFDDKDDYAISNLAAQHYPELESAPLENQIRSGAHTDFGALTLLLTEDKPGGLEVMGLDDEWHAVRPIPGAFIVNIGDLFGRWTNDRWRSTLHRVVNPPPGISEPARRLSIVFFYEMNEDALIECIPTCADAEHPAKYAPIRAGEHLSEKLRRVEIAPATV